VLNNFGPDLYDEWIAAKIPWTDACIKQSFEMFDSIVQTKGYVLGGTQRILSTADADGADQHSGTRSVDQTRWLYVRQPQCAAGTYPDSVAGSLAANVADAKVVRFDAGDVMPASLQQA